MQHVTDHESAERYSYVNIPPSLQLAIERLQEVDVDISRVTSDLKSLTDEHFRKGESYDDWNFRATRALNHMKREKNFLVQWTNHMRNEIRRAERKENEREIGESIRAMAAGFLQTATPYVAVYSDKKLPESLSHANKRRHELVDLKFEYERFLTYLKEESLKVGCAPRHFQAARGKVARVIYNAERELLFIKRARRMICAAKIQKGERVRGLDPLPSTDPRLPVLNEELRKIKVELQMNSADMTVWLLSLIKRQNAPPPLIDGEERRLKLIERYADLTVERLTIQV